MVVNTDLGWPTYVDIYTRSSSLHECLRGPSLARSLTLHASPVADIIHALSRIFGSCRRQLARSNHLRMYSSIHIYKYHSDAFLCQLGSHIQAAIEKPAPSSPDHQINKRHFSFFSSTTHTSYGQRVLWEKQKLWVGNRPSQITERARRLYVCRIRICMYA